MLLFSIKQGTLPPGLAGTHGLPPVKVAVYLNILGIVVLAEPSETFSEVPSGETANDVGIDRISELHDDKCEKEGKDPLI